MRPKRNNLFDETAIGAEIVTAPSILFLDEPTSGLDSASAFSVMKSIFDLSKSGCTIICTIHQYVCPSLL